jgi:hypothetical protein
MVWSLEAVMTGDELSIVDSSGLLQTKSMKYSQLSSPRTNSSRTDAHNVRAHLHGHLVDGGVASINGNVMNTGDAHRSISRNRENQRV